MDVHGRIREILAETIREELAPDQQHLSTEDLIKALRRRGIIDDVMKELNFVTVSNLLGEIFCEYILMLTTTYRVHIWGLFLVKPL